jgi:hypothetical protein
MTIRFAMLAAACLLSGVLSGCNTQEQPMLHYAKDGSGVTQDNSCKSDTFACNKHSKARQSAGATDTDRLIPQPLLRTNRFSFLA